MGREGEEKRWKEGEQNGRERPPNAATRKERRKLLLLGDQIRSLHLWGPTCLSLTPPTLATSFRRLFSLQSILGRICLGALAKGIEAAVVETERREMQKGRRR